jgi:hypothetical protein
MHPGVTVMSEGDRPLASRPLVLPFHPASPDGTFGKPRPDPTPNGFQTEAVFIEGPDLDPLPRMGGPGPRHGAGEPRF